MSGWRPWRRQPEVAARPVTTRRPPALPPRREPGTRHAEPAQRALIAAANALPDGATVDDALLDAVLAEAAARRAGAGLEDGPAVPRPHNLRVRTTDLPDWWRDSGSLLLQSPDSARVEVALGLLSLPVRNTLIVVGDHVVPPRFNIIGDDAMVLFGDNVTMLGSAMTVGAGATVMVGEQTTATWMTFADVRNGGLLVIGADCMLASGIALHTDDTHAIRDAVTDERLNIFGGRIMLDDHVWVADHARLMGDCRVGTNSVVGATAFVKNAFLPAGTVSVGRPARPTRHGIVWSRFDLP